ncbi:hypothetical protein F4X90_10335 [Candidatus Poribacteria bacterium]|nr:hypothetical protein [Candidatus Poribacteria bacterium]
MDRKIGIMVVILVLSLMFADQGPVLFPQTPEGSTTKKEQSSNDTSTGKVSNSSQKDSATQTSSKIPSQKTQSSDDTSSEKVDPKAQSANETTKKEATTDNSKNLIGIGTLMLGIAAVLGVLLKLAQFIHKVKSKEELPDIAPNTGDSEIAEKLDKILKIFEHNPKAPLIEKAIAEAYTLERSEAITDKITKTTDVTFQGSTGTYNFEVYPPDTSFNAVGGVYIFAKYVPSQYGTGTYVPLYIGQTISLRNRILEHQHHGKWKCAENYGVNCICVHQDANSQSRREKEADLLAVNHPPCNKRLPLSVLSQHASRLRA